MSHATETAHAPPPAGVRYQPILPISTGKFAMWLFLATEIMFFTGLIGSYIVLRFGAKTWPTPFGYVVKLNGGKELLSNGEPHEKSGKLIFDDMAGKKHEIPVAEVVTQSERGHAGLLSKKETPLSLGLTAFNTFLLICSSVTMVLALASIQQNEMDWGRRRQGFPWFGFRTYMLLTIVIGAIFVGIQFYEYNALIFHDEFRPSSSIYASCFYVMTGCHGAHVSGGVIYNTALFIGATKNKWNASRAGSIELAGLYWHFVDLVWIILFTVVYLI
jgi:cytochrome c oxidase subunit III